MFIVFITWKPHRGSVELVVLKVYVMLLVCIILIIIYMYVEIYLEDSVVRVWSLLMYSS